MRRRGRLVFFVKQPVIYAISLMDKKPCGRVVAGALRLLCQQSSTFVEHSLVDSNQVWNVPYIITWYESKCGRGGTCGLNASPLPLLQAVMAPIWQNEYWQQTPLA